MKEGRLIIPYQVLSKTAVRLLFGLGVFTACLWFAVKSCQIDNPKVHSLLRMLDTWRSASFVVRGEDSLKHREVAVYFPIERVVGYIKCRLNSRTAIANTVKLIDERSLLMTRFLNLRAASAASPIIPVSATPASLSRGQLLHSPDAPANTTEAEREISQSPVEPLDQLLAVDSSSKPGESDGSTTSPITGEQPFYSYKRRFQGAYVFPLGLAELYIDDRPGVSDFRVGVNDPEFHLTLASLDPYSQLLILDDVQAGEYDELYDQWTTRFLHLLLVLSVGAFLLAAIARQSKICVSKSDITLPFNLLPSMRFRLSRVWSDLECVKLQERAEKGGGSPEQFNLMLQFRSGGSACLDLAILSIAQARELLAAIEQWADAPAVFPEVTALRHRLARADDSVQKKSYTALWEEDLSSQFAATNFVPLPMEKTLQSGAIKVIAQLGSGGMSAVYLALREGRTVVLKESVVPALVGESLCSKARELFQREAQLLMRLDHQRIAKLHDHFVEGGRDYLVLEYIPGKTLREHVQTCGQLSEQRVVEIAKQICEILTYLHGRDPPVIHRDLTPDNLVMTAGGQISVIDFGAANLFIGTATGTLVGKQLYMAPEQFRGKAQPLSDIYALGVTLHYLLTGKEPGALSVSHPGQYCQDLANAVDQLVASCTQFEAANRPASAASLLDRLDRLQKQLGDGGGDGADSSDAIISLSDQLRSPREPIVSPDEPIVSPRELIISLHEHTLEATL